MPADRVRALAAEMAWRLRRERRRRPDWAGAGRAQALPDDPAALIPGCGHMMLNQRPDLVAELIGDMATVASHV